MQLSTTFRHMDVSQAVRSYCEERLEKIRKYFHRDPLSAHATFAVERGFQHVADLHITLPNGLVIKAKETTEDMYSSIDLAAARIERQVRKWKDKIRDHKPHGHPDVTVRHDVLTESFDGEGSPRAKGKKGKAKGATTPGGAGRVTPPPAPRIRVVEEKTFTARAMRPEDAVMQMNLIGNGFLVFLNAETKAVAVVYRRRDGEYGLIDTSHIGA